MTREAELRSISSLDLFFYNRAHLSFYSRPTAHVCLARFITFLSDLNIDGHKKFWTFLLLALLYIIHILYYFSKTGGKMIYGLRVIWKARLHNMFTYYLNL